MAPPCVVRAITGQVCHVRLELWHVCHLVQVRYVRYLVQECHIRLQETNIQVRHVIWVRHISHLVCMCHVRQQVSCSSLGIRV